VGDEIDLSSFRKRQLNPAELNQATELVMQTITGLVEELRGEKAPGELWDPQKAGQTTSGNFKKAGK
jgi:1-acyl-sn-glycerol-3-phosphate acyltransferase